MNLQHPFVGRVAELAALEETLARAILGQGGAVVLSGEPGIGKTRLASELGDRAERRGARVVWGRCAIDAQAPAYWPFVQLLRGLYPNADAAELVRRFGPGARDVLALMRHAGVAPAEPGSRDPSSASPSDALRFRLFDAVTSMLLSASAERPLVLVLDDIHAADPGCLQLVVFLARGLRGSRVLLLATMRAAEARRPEVAPILLGTLAREALALSVDGWTREEVGAFLSPVTDGAPNADLVDSVHRASAGNPFFVGEITRMLKPGDAAEGFPVPAHVRQAVLARTDVLDAVVAGTLRTASIVGLAFDARTVAAMDTRDIVDVGRSLAEAAEAGFVERAGEHTWNFRHEIARDVLYESIAPPARRHGHSSAAAALARSARSDEAVAHHLLCALPDGDLASTLEAVLRTARDAASALAHERAASWLGRGLDAVASHAAAHGDLAGDAEVRRLEGEFLLALGDAKWSAGDLAGSRAAFEDAAALAGRSGDRTLLARAALGAGGRQQRAHVQYDARIVELLERGLAGCDDPELLARLKARLAYALYAAPGSRADRGRLAAEAVDLVRGHGGADALRAVLADHRWALWGPDTLAERIATSNELLAAAQRSHDREAALVEHGWQVVQALEAGDRAELDRAFAAYRAGAAELRLPWYQWYATRFACLVAQVEGRLDDAAALAADALAAGEQAGHPDAPLAFGSQMLSIRLAQDRVAELEAALEMNVAQYPDVTLWRRLLARIRVAQGREADAAGEIELARAGDLVESPGDFLHLPSLAILAELVAASGDEGACRRVFDALLPYSGRQVLLGFGMGYLGPVDQYLGEIAAVLGRSDEARALFEKAADQGVRLGAARWISRARLSLRMSAALRTAPLPVAAPPSPSVATAVLRGDAGGWSGEFAGAPFRVGALRGMVYLRALLAEPEREMHVLELAALGGHGARDAGEGLAVSDRADRSDSGPLLDEQAKRAYRRRLADLKAELQEATDFADSGRIAVARAEIEALEDELSRAVGLGGRDRRGQSSAERARVAVAKRVRGALERLGEQSPELQRYLEATVRTGVFCVYRPDPGRPVDWRFPAG